ncbi:MAG: hypothetical protein KGI38_10015 [Thaumarchaeota archaeon]|nr:hypothetical protein [Nitrososphaerota archaeon]
MTNRDSERVAGAQKAAMEMMSKAGFDVGNGIQVSVDPRLPFMGYTHPEGGGYRIVVSGGAVESIMLKGLLLHEMSHIYRMKTGHPSHSAQVVEEAVGSLGERALHHDYQRKIIYDLTNNIEDLYADDIAVQLMKDDKTLPPDLMSRFLQDWVKSDLAEGNDATKVRWLNGWTMTNNARAIAQMTRHGVEDLGGKAAAENQRFLSKVDPAIANRFGYFLNLLTSLREDITDDEYRRLLTDYLGNFVSMVENQPEVRQRTPDEAARKA